MICQRKSRNVGDRSPRLPDRVTESRLPAHIVGRRLAGLYIGDGEERQNFQRVRYRRIHSVPLVKKDLAIKSADGILGTVSYLCKHCLRQHTSMENAIRIDSYNTITYGELFEAGSLWRLK